MGDWRTDPTFAMCRTLVDGADLASFAGGPFDIRAVVAAIRPGTFDGAVLDTLPWGNFPHGENAREAVRLLRTGDEPARNAMGVLIGMCADNSRAAAALAVPFLIRIAADPHHRHRADALGGLAAPARARHFGVASRDELLLHRSGPQHDGYDDYGVEVTGYPAGWSVAAARAAITNGAPVLLPLLAASDPAIRIDASYALATATDPGHTVRSAFATRCAKEQDPMVRAALVLATAEITRAHPHQPATGWIRELWQDRAQAPEVRLAAAIGWLCLTDEPAPGAMHTTVEALATEERARAMDALPWMAAAGRGEPGLLDCVRRMLHPEEPEPSDDPWA
ncbi:hypothetical protein GCM10010264_63440 [Streptomyces globisporus]|uniref:hypothetical protein n=3 Tax=Streptomyces TaxID=1883 RepID=UPI000BF1D843|nr:hypothetical protein GCM10010264_63440 [Streptomyces globisporus]